MSLPIELFLGYGLLALICQRCGSAVAEGVCPHCGDDLDEIPTDDAEELEDDA